MWHAHNNQINLASNRDQLVYQQQLAYDLLVAAARIREMDHEMSQKFCGCSICMSGGRCSLMLQILKDQLKQLERELGPT
jgi:hypothetical protein